MIKITVNIEFFKKKCKVLIIINTVNYAHVVSHSDPILLYNIKSTPLYALIVFHIHTHFIDSFADGASICFSIFYSHGRLYSLSFCSTSIWIAFVYRYEKNRHFRLIFTVLTHRFRAIKTHIYLCDIIPFYEPSFYVMCNTFFASYILYTFILFVYVKKGQNMLSACKLHIGLVIMWFTHVLKKKRLICYAYAVQLWKCTEISSSLHFAEENWNWSISIYLNRSMKTDICVHRFGLYKWEVLYIYEKYFLYYNSI